MLQCVAVCCSMFQYVAVRTGDKVRDLDMHFTIHRWFVAVATCVAACCSVLQCSAVCCSVSQCVLQYRVVSVLQLLTNSSACALQSPDLGGYTARWGPK